MIRDATQEDAQRLAEMGADFFKEAGLEDRGVTFDVESFLTFCGGLASVGVLLVAEKDEAVVGMIGLVVMPAYWNVNVRLAQEAFLWVDPAHRKGVGRMLLEEGEKRALAMGAVLSSMVSEHGLRGDAVGQLFRRKGYAPAETVFWKRLAA